MEMGRLFNEGHKNVHDDLWSGRLSVVNEDLVCAFEEKSDDSPLHHFPFIFLKFHSLLHGIVSDKLKFQKLCAHCVLKMLTEEHKLKRQAGTLDFQTQYSEEGENFLSCLVTGMRHGCSMKPLN